MKGCCFCSTSHSPGLQVDTASRSAVHPHTWPQLCRPLSAFMDRRARWVTAQGVTKSRAAAEHSAFQSSVSGETQPQLGSLV